MSAMGGSGMYCNPDNHSGQLREQIAFAIDDLETQRFRHTC